MIGTWILGALIICTYYKSNLMSMLIAPRVVIPFSNFEELVEQNEIPYKMPDGSHFVDIARVRIIWLQFLRKIRDIENIIIHWSIFQNIDWLIIIKISHPINIFILLVSSIIWLHFSELFLKNSIYLLYCMSTLMNVVCFYFILFLDNNEWQFYASLKSLFY